MEISFEKLNSLFFSFRISSGPPVIVFYSQIDDEIYAIFWRRKNESDIEIFKYDPSTMLSRVMDDMLMVELHDAITNFVPPAELRDIKINQLLNE